MARIRSMRPELFSSASMIRCSVEARFLFLGLWVFADDQGIHPADVLQLKAEVFPADSFTEAQVAGWMREVIAQECVETFSVPTGSGDSFKGFETREFWIVVNWHLQRIDRPFTRYPPIRDLWLKQTHRHPIGNMHMPINAARIDPLVPAAGEPTAETETWRKAIELANAHCAGLQINRKPQDRSLILKTCFLIVQGRLPEHWLVQGIKGLRAKERDNPAAFLTKVFKNLAGEMKPPIDLRRLLAETPSPPPNSPPAATTKKADPKTNGATKQDIAAVLQSATKPPPADSAKTTAERHRDLERQLAEIKREEQTAARAGRATKPQRKKQK